jgi:hypothetical protein
MKSLDFSSNSLFILPLLKGPKNLPLAPCLHTALSRLQHAPIDAGIVFVAILFYFYKSVAEVYATPVMYDLVSG